MFRARYKAMNGHAWKDSNVRIRQFRSRMSTTESQTEIHSHGMNQGSLGRRPFTDGMNLWVVGSWMEVRNVLRFIRFVVTHVLGISVSDLQSKCVGF